MKRALLTLILGCSFLQACAPAVQDREFSPPKADFGPRTEDTHLGDKVDPSGIKAILSWQGEVPTYQLFQQADHLIALGKTSETPALASLGLSWIQQFYANSKNTAFTSLGDSPFATIAATATEDEVQKTLEEVHQDLDNSRKILKARITKIGAEYSWPAKPSDLTGVLDQAGKFVKSITAAIPTMPISKAIADGVQAELRKGTEELFGEMRSAISTLYSTKQFPEALKLVDSLVKKMKLDLPSATKTKLDQARLIAQDLEAVNDPQSGLTILIDVWRALTSEERITYFKAENDALYDFLSDQSDKSLNCLRRPGCSSGLFQGIKKLVFILPRIDLYGVEKIKKRLNSEALTRLVNEVESQAFAYLKNLPQTIVTQIDAGLVGKNKELQGIQKNYPDYLQGLLNKWAAKNFPKTQGKVKGTEVALLKLKLSASSKLSIAPLGPSRELKAATLGASLTAAVNVLQSKMPSQEERTHMALSQINKLIAIGGYREEEKDLAPYAQDFSAASFSEQIYGLSHMLQITADWKPSAFDDTLGKVRAQALTKDITSPALDRPLFPKDTMFALNLANAAFLLKTITKHSTPVFLITLDNKTIWADQYRSGGKASPIMAGLVDIKDGKRSNTVQSNDVASFLISLAEFLKATDGYENAKSPLLRERGDEKQIPMESLKEGRRDIRLLIVAMANFISNQLMDENGFIQGSYYLSQLERSNDPNYSVDSQTHAIRALIKAWEITGIDAYLNSAKEIYFAMNKHAYSVEEGFYVNGDGTSLNFPKRVHALRALNDLKAHLPTASQEQLTKISAPWLKALEELQ